MPHELRRQDLGGRALRNQAAAVEHGHAIGEARGGVQVVQDEYDGPAIAREPAGETKQVQTVGQIEVRGRFVEQQDLRFGGEAASHQHALQLAA